MGAVGKRSETYHVGDNRVGEKGRIGSQKGEGEGSWSVMEKVELARPSWGSCLRTAYLPGPSGAKLAVDGSAPQNFSPHLSGLFPIALAAWLA